MRAALVLTAAWVMFLAALAISSATTVTLNRQQILDADVFVSGWTVPELSPYLVEQGRFWPIDGYGITIRNLQDVPFKSRQELLFPLTRLSPEGVNPKRTKIPPLRGQEAGFVDSSTTNPFDVPPEYEVTRSQNQDGVPLAYPLTTDVLRQLKAIRPEVFPPDFPSPTLPVLRD